MKNEELFENDLKELCLKFNSNHENRTFSGMIDDVIKENCKESSEIDMDKYSLFNPMVCEILERIWDFIKFGYKEDTFERFIRFLVTNYETCYSQQFMKKLEGHQKIEGQAKENSEENN